ncbi:uncharacterized protein LOC124915302 [Impatiens glandulifera]|uniref:uncharacterized protein LOC124915302 n=1 Tax=Impatiens glandulifera TaxID=253017 RepID=UPI001FB185F6|nr:uncharacterized protein LOC124915302 [Impatiens glandulifera]
MKDNNKILKIKLPETSNSNFTKMVMRAAVARISQSVGFRGCSQSVLDIFTSVASKYLGALAQSAAKSAALSDQSSSPTCNLLDILYALEDLNSNRGFTGASDITRPILNSSLLTDLIRFSTSIQINKSIKPIVILHEQQQQQQQQQKQSSDCGLNITENMKRYSHIPDWLPPIPDMKLLCDDDNKSRARDDVLFGQITTTTEELLCSGFGNTKLEATKLPNKRENVRFKMGGKCVKRLRPPLNIMGINGVSCFNSSKVSEPGNGVVDLKSGVCNQNLLEKKKKEEEPNNLQAIHHLQFNTTKFVQ